MTMSTTGNPDGTAAASGGILSREGIIAKTGFNLWLVPPAALAIHLCIGMAYGFSVFWLPLSRSVGTATGAKVPSCAGAATTFCDKTLGTLTALTATNCEWTQFDLGWMFTLFFRCVRLLGPDLRRLARACLAAQGRRLRGALLVRRPDDIGDWRQNGPVSQRLGGYRDHRRGIVDVAGDVRRRTVP
jgi:hypothetical protein